MANFRIGKYKWSNNASHEIEFWTGILNPEGNLSAPVGSKYYNSATGVEWTKATGSSNTGWILASQNVLSGTTANRPAVAATNIGYQYFDTTLGVLITWNGTVWVIMFLPVANTTDTVTKAFLNTTYPVATYPVGCVISYYNQGKEYQRVTSTIWSEKTITLTA